MALRALRGISLSCGLERTHSVLHITKPGVLVEDFLVQLERTLRFICRFVCLREVVSETVVLLFPTAGKSEPLGKPFDGDVGHAFLHEAQPEHAATLEPPELVFLRELKFRYRLIEQPHLLVSNPEIVAGVVVFRPELLFDALAELLEDLIETGIGKRTFRLVLVLVDDALGLEDLVGQIGRQIDKRLPS